MLGSHGHCLLLSSPLSHLDCHESTALIFLPPKLFVSFLKVWSEIHMLKSTYNRWLKIKRIIMEKSNPRMSWEIEYCYLYFPWRRAQQPTLAFLSGESHGQRSLAGYSAWGRRTQLKWLSTHLYFRSLHLTASLNSLNHILIIPKILVFCVVNHICKCWWYYFFLPNLLAVFSIVLSYLTG